MKFESVTGKATVYVHQDFWAQVLVYNMVQDIRNSADEEAAAAGRENRNKYPMHTNENVAILYFVFDRIMFSDHNPTIFRPLYSVKSDVMICSNSLIWTTNRYKKSSIVNVIC